LASRASEKPQTLLPWIQALRALAAVSVAFVHIAHDDIANGGDPAGIFKTITKFFPWDAGVDIFFVISGFVIVHASARLFETRTGPRVFLRRRLTRIVPLYWLMTTAFLAVALLSRDQIHAAIGGPAYVLASYLFIPWPRPDGVMQPALGLGWTLNHEMFFYAVFTPFLLLPRRIAVVTAGALLCLIAAIGPALAALNPQLGCWSNPIILEFVFGMEIALITSMRITLPFAARIVLVIAALAAFHLNADGAGIRPLVYGLPAAALVAAAALAPAPNALNRAEAWLVRLGDASYALYLVHPFVMRGFTVLWHKIHAHHELSGTIYVLSGLVIAQSFALLINASLERRLQAWLRRREVVNEVV
jgi:exopolysaccharide production protein ExoZ